MEKQDLENLVVEGINIGKQLNTIQNCGDLSDVRNAYVIWRDNLQKTFSRADTDFIRYSNLFENDEVMETLNRGCGIDLSDSFAQSLISKIKSEVKTKLDFIRDYAKEIFSDSKNKLITKDSKSYYYKGLPLNFPRGTLYGDWFEIIFNHCDATGNITYDSLKNKLGFKHKLNTSSLKNAYDNFFRNAKVEGKAIDQTTPDGEKIFQTRKGKGIKFNNPQI